MSEPKIQEVSDGFVKSPKWVERELHGPNSALPAKIRVFLFIKYRIQNNKKSSECENISREFIIEKTGIFPKNFNRIIKHLEKDRMIHVQRGNYRDSVASYSLHRDRFTQSVIVPDPDKAKLQNEVTVDNFQIVKKRNFNLKSEIDLKLQNEVTELQIEVETPLTISELLGKIPLRTPVSRPPEESISPEGKPGDSFTLLRDGNGKKSEEEIVAANRKKMRGQQMMLEQNGWLETL